MAAVVRNAHRRYSIPAARTSGSGEVMSASRERPSEHVTSRPWSRARAPSAAAFSSVMPSSETSTPSKPRSVTFLKIGAISSVQGAIHNPE